MPLAAIALAVLVAPAVSGANPSHSVASLRARDAAIAAKSRAAVLDVYSLDAQLTRSQSQLASLYGQARSLRAQRAVLETQLGVARRSARIGERRLALRVRQLYEQGSVEPLEIVLGATSLDDAVSNLDNLSRASSQDEAVLRQLKSARKRTQADSRALASRESALAAATRHAQAVADSLESERSDRAEYVDSLAAQRRLTQQQIGVLLARARAAEVRSAQLVVVRTSDVALTSAPSDSLPSSGHTLTVNATGYALSGTTATGLPVGWGIAAVDPSVIPLGTHLFVPGYGEAVAADTGGAVVGDTIDLWFPTVAQADAWGRRTVSIVLH